MCTAYMLYHSVFQVQPPLLSFLSVSEYISSRAIRRAFAQLLPIILHQ